MNNNFKGDEIVKVQGKSYPVVGGRLRLAHEDNKETLSIKTEIREQTNERVTIQATVVTKTGEFNGLGNATASRDFKLKNAILELAETRAIARALRFAGYGVEYTGYEEVQDIEKKADTETALEVTEDQIGELYDLADLKGYAIAKVQKWAKENCGIDSIFYISKEKYFELYKNLQALPDK